ncbi:erythromycin esterase [Cordyceps javanica]|uniref:Erythromycin esterase n=1 Tax=Cordyceps javanica TaxID=43265 RepID=A0A545UX81_9HYPO|nr:erythromycin esterase [Cordyceps javanica]TQW05958.1 erythromycin esterase [Cordyceps javanica]
MSPLRRRSARIASTSKKTKAVPELLSVTEDAEPVATSSPRRSVAKSPMTAPSTPPSSAIRPPRSEMHPSKFHQSTGEPSSAVALGFTDIEATDRRTTGTALTATPSRSTGIPTSSFTFDLATSTNGSMLSSDARKIMEELQEKAAKIKVELVAKREAEGMDSSAVGDRRFAKPKSLAGRYSAVHAAEFDKMDSIEGHASAWRAKTFTPVVSGIKRSPSKASLAESPSKAAESPSAQKTSIYRQLSQSSQKNLKRKSSAANLDGRSGVESPKKSHQDSSPSKGTDRTPGERQPVKRVKQRKEDDTSTNRPKPATTPTASRTTQRPQSTLSRLRSPTKSSRMHTSASPAKAAVSSVPTPTKPMVSPRKPTISMISTPSKPSASPVRVAAPPTPSFAQSLSAGTSKADGLARRILSPMRMQKVKSILRSQPAENSAAGSAIPQPALYGSHTPAPPRRDKDLPPAPFTTPRRKLTKKVTFTPETKRAAAEQGSPSPLKPSLFRFRSASGPRSIRDVEVKSTATEHGGHVAYPDLSAFKDIIDSKDEDGKERAPSVPSSFTFRSDHTIEFGDAPKTGFGSSVGQSSVRHVRQSLNQAASLPGSFPAPPAASSHPDKENTAPSSPSKALAGVLHGLTSKKRHRPSTDEEDAAREAAERASKKRKNTMSAPERPALSSAKAISSTPQSSAKRARLDRNTALTPSRQQLSKTRTATPGSASPAKKTQGMSMSRLQALARPKTRV